MAMIFFVSKQLQVITSKVILAFIAVSALVLLFSQSSAKADELADFVAGQKAMQKQNFAAAKNIFTKTAQAKPFDVSCQYYLALAAAQMKDYKLAKEAMSKVIVASPSSSPYHANAKQFFHNFSSIYNNVTPYSAFTEGTLIRWPKSKMPLKVYISNGLTLPKGYQGTDLGGSKIAELQPYLNRADFYKQLQRAPRYHDEYKKYIVDGLNQWQWSNKEGFLKYQLVDNPTKANILVFWCESMGNQSGLTVTTANPEHKTIIQIITKYANYVPLWLVLKEITVASAHEFGHAFGLYQHSPSKQDVMFDGHEKMTIHWSGGVNYIPSGVSENDRLTLRTLYSFPDRK